MESGTRRKPQRRLPPEVKKVAKKAYAVSMLAWLLVNLATPITARDQYRSAANVIKLQQKESLQIAKGRMS
jgi:hypothetical protein